MGGHQSPQNCFLRKDPDLYRKLCSQAATLHGVGWRSIYNFLLAIA